VSSSDFDFEDLLPRDARRPLPSQSSIDFASVLSSAEQIEKDAAKFIDGSLKRTNEFGELIDEDEYESEEQVVYYDQEVTDTCQQAQEPTTLLTNQSINEVESTPNQRNVLSETQSLSNQTDRSTNRNATWLKNSVLAPTETDKEFEMFSCYVRLGGGRSIQYVSQITNFGIEKLKKVAARNNWVQRAADFDRYQLSRKMAEVEGERHKLHLKKLEEYREQQEQIGQQLSLSAARIAYLANRKLTNMLDSDQDLDTRDLPSLLNSAAKLAEVGKNLQGGALGVDQLLAAIEESDVD
jgi:hypothetical protein